MTKDDSQSQEPVAATLQPNLADPDDESKSKLENFDWSWVKPEHLGLDSKSDSSEKTPSTKKALPKPSFPRRSSRIAQKKTVRWALLEDDDEPKTTKTEGQEDSKTPEAEAQEGKDQKMDEDIRDIVEKALLVLEKTEKNTVAEESPQVDQEMDVSDLDINADPVFEHPDALSTPEEEEEL